jgi:two-component system cell cycle sensor histidine kinase/response regulator CckA
VKDEGVESLPVEGRTTADALWTATERLRAVEEAAPIGIVALDLDGRVTIWNRAAEELFGWSASEVIAGPYPLIPPDRHAEDRALRARVLAGEVFSGIETCHLRKDGTQVSVSQSCGPIRDAQGLVSGTIRVLTDITEAKRLAHQFLQAQKMEAFGQLAGGIAHDFNNLLTVILGFSELALDRVQQPEIRPDIEEIRKAGERASELTRQLLAFSRKQVWVVQVLDLNYVVRQFEKMLSRVIRENVHLEIVTPQNLGQTRADPGQVEQLLMNLVVNARDAMPLGGDLTIATADAVLDATFARQHVGAVPGRYISLRVQDTGCGMTPEVLARVFEPFFTTKEPGKGTGLGLSTVFGLVEQSGGYITIESRPGAGTTVTTYWPAVDEFVKSVLAEAAEPRLEGTETILLVEDEAGVRHLIGKVLEGYGYTVLSAQDADHAIAIEEQYVGTIHLLVSDMIMPGLSGADLAQRIAPRRPTMQVLFVSGYASREAIELGLSGQNAGLLQKPFKPATLARKVRERLDRHVDRRAPPPLVM